MNHGWIWVLVLPGLLAGCQTLTSSRTVLSQPEEANPLRPVQVAEAAPEPAIPEPTLAAKVAFDEHLPAASDNPQPASPGEELPAPLGAAPVGGEISLAQVTESVYYAFPAIEGAIREIEIAEGKQTAAWGEFDLKLKAESISRPQGFYKTYRNGVKLEQAVQTGGMVYGQYRIGDGNFEPWYGERETNKGGEFKLGVLAPLLRGRAIDLRRADIYQATLRRQQVDPMVRAVIIDFTYIAADIYWSWVAAAQSRTVQQSLLDLTVERNRIYEVRVKNQDLAPIELTQNQRLVAQRRAKVIDADRKLQQSAIKLSLFLRDEAGQPFLAEVAQAPAEFPQPEPPSADQQATDISIALGARPELRELELIRQQVQVDLQLAQNQTMPSFDASLEAAKDVGFPASSKGDKTPFELEAGLFFEVPYQRRKAYGKIREAEGKLAQIAAKRRLTENKIVTEVQDAYSALQTAYDRIEQAQLNVRYARELVQAERTRFDAQDSDLLRVALQESAAVEAELEAIAALADYHKALAAYRAALAADPLGN